MTDKTARQIENMKKQTIGVEVEMNNINREKAARTAADFFKTGRYEFTAPRNGYVTWSAWDMQGREWKFQRDVSIEGPDDEKCELVTPILTYGDIETLQDLLRALRKAGAMSSASRGCGVHIHIGLKSEAGDHTAQTLTNLANIMAAHEEQIGRAIKIDERRSDEYCMTVSRDFLNMLHAEKPKTMDELADVWYRGNRANSGRDNHYNSSRYHMLNLHACFTKGTIEFRLFQFDEPHDGKKGGIHCGQLKAYIQLCLAMSQLAKDLQSARSKPQQRENEKYAFRCWMLRLGFIGEEFKTARKLLLQNVSGNGAWRHR
ncbi:MAG: amidoligase family protein [Synergistaceae bacterium]|nr:amidoligase family protein [Synergistaceae bacterium]